jgi:hypothetical protein
MFDFNKSIQTEILKIQIILTAYYFKNYIYSIDYQYFILILSFHY